MEIEARVLVSNLAARHMQATWWKLDGQWKCVGAMQPWSQWILDLLPDEAAGALRAEMVPYKWIDRKVNVPAESLKARRRRQQ